MITGRIFTPRFLSSLHRLLGLSSARLSHEIDGPLMGGNLLEYWRKRARYRSHLRRLTQTDPRLLEDIGLSVRAAGVEIEKPFWCPRAGNRPVHFNEQPGDEYYQSSGKAKPRKFASAPHGTAYTAPTSYSGHTSPFDRPRII